MPVAVASYSRSTDDSYSSAVSRPSGTAAGDLLVAFVSVAYDTALGGAARLGAATGFTEVASHDNGKQCSKVFTKIATASEPASYTFAWSGSTAVVKGASVARVTGARLAAPFQAAPLVRGSTSTGDTYPVTGLTAAGPGLVLIGAATHAYTEDFAYSLPTGFTSTLASPYASQQATFLAAKPVTSAGAQGPWSVPTNFVASYAQGEQTTTMFLVGQGALVLTASIAPTAALIKTAQRTFTASTTPAAAVALQRVVVRVFTAVLGGLTDPAYPLTEELTEDMPGTDLPRLGAVLVKVPHKALGGTLIPAASLRVVPRKVLEAVVAPAGFLRRRVVLSFSASLTPRATLVTRWVGRIFGQPGVVVARVVRDATVRARIRRN